MPLIDAGYFMTSNAFVYSAPSGTAAPSPSSLDDPGVDYVLLGHLATEEGDGMPEFGLDGGDVTPKGSMSKKQIRTITDPVTREVTFSLTQFTREALKLYYGGDGGAVAGVFDISSDTDGTSTERALLFTFRDGDKWAGYWAGRAAISGADSLDTSDPENALAVPLKAIALDPVSGSGPRAKWLSVSLFSLS